jgi:hypothetical protein
VNKDHERTGDEHGNEYQDSPRKSPFELPRLEFSGRML